MVSHHFGTLNQGFYEFFGLDQATTRIGFEYGVNDWLGIGIVVKHTAKNITIINGFRSYASKYAKNGICESFSKSSRPPHDVLLTDVNNIEDPKELEEVLKHWNRINKTDIEIKIV